MNLPKISIITPSFNSIHTIQETIESVLNQKYPKLEHIIMDGGSTDGTVEILKKYPHLIWISEKDEGHYDAMNKGIARASGELINILNADDCFRPGALLTVAAAYAKNPTWEASFGDVVFVDGQNREIYRREEAVYDYDVLRLWQDYICHHTLFVRKSVYDRLGGYRYRDYLNCCDYELILRLGRERCEVGRVPEFLVNYRYHQYGQSADLRITQNMRRESALIRKEHGCPDGLVGRFLRVYCRAKRQMQKLFYRGKCDLIPGHWRLKKHMRAKTDFTSNCGVHELKAD